MKKIFSILVMTIFLFACTGETREQGDATNRDSTESRSTDGSINEGTDTTTSATSPAAPGATNAQY